MASRESETGLIIEIRRLSSSLKNTLLGGKIANTIKESQKAKEKNLNKAKKTYSRQTSKDNKPKKFRIGFSKNILKWRNELGKYELSFSKKKSGDLELVTGNKDMSVTQINQLNNNNYQVFPFTNLYSSICLLTFLEPSKVENSFCLGIN